jgi:hypothetical protein
MMDFHVGGVLPVEVSKFGHEFSKLTRTQARSDHGAVQMRVQIDQPRPPM